MNQGAINALVRFVEDIFFILLANYLGVEFLGQTVRIHLTVKKLPTHTHTHTKETANSFSKGLFHFPHLPAIYEFQLLCIPLTFWLR